MLPNDFAGSLQWEHCNHKHQKHEIDLKLGTFLDMISPRIFSLLGAVSISIHICYGAAVAWTGKCKELTEGYDLTPDYDAKLPPNSLNVSLHTHIFDISEVDDFKQLVTIRFATSYAWKESRINFKKNSVYGKSLTGSVLNSVFVENCLCHPHTVIFGNLKMFCRP